MIEMLMTKKDEAKPEMSLKDKLKVRKAKAEAVEAQPAPVIEAEEIQSGELPL